MTVALVYHNAGGNPGGYLSLTDPTANAWYWCAPPTLLGNMSGAYGGTLSLDLVLRSDRQGSPATRAETEVLSSLTDV